MKKNLLTILSLSIVFISASAFIIKNAGVGGYVGSPGENTCTQCHGASTAVSGTSIIATPAFTGNQFVPGQTYTIQIGVGCLTLGNFGFACEIIGAGNNDIGVMQNPQAGVQFSVGATGRKNATHTTKKAGTSFTTFQFEWVAPNSGTARIYAAGNAVNNNGLATGDAVSTASLALTASTLSAVSEVKSNISAINIYPNPIKSDFSFNYSLMESGMVKVTLHDLQGKEIDEFVNENQTNGLHTVKATLPADLSKGVYMMKFSINGQAAAQRLIITQ